MKKETEKLAEATVALEKDLNKLTVDKVNEAKGEEPEIQKISLENKYKSEGVQYIKPRRLSAPLGKLPDKLKTEHKRAWEYVTGIYENIAIPGEAIKFTYVWYPGDADYLWIVPANVPVAVPRMIANHLEKTQEYHTFGHRENPSNSMHIDNFTHTFQVSGVNYRGKFRPIGAFA